VSYRDGLAIFGRPTKSDPGNAGWHKWMTFYAKVMSKVSAHDLTVRATLEVPANEQLMTVTAGNHLYVPVDFFFHKDAVGGRNRCESAPRTVSVTFIPGGSIETDIDETKRILRARASVGDFFTRAGIAEGDVVAITNTGPYQYMITNARDERSRAFLVHKIMDCFVACAPRNDGPCVVVIHAVGAGLGCPAPVAFTGSPPSRG
jgi:hypothetical protein